MKIVHAGWFEMGSVHGTHHALFNLARAQAAAGHDVSILNLGWQPAPAAVDAARRDGIRLLGHESAIWRDFWRDPGDSLRRCIEELAPDIVHLQYVRIPKFAALARVLTRLGISYCVSLHGGWKSEEMVRHRRRKLAYWHLVERWIHQHAAAIHFVTEAERRDYYSELGVAKSADAVVPNVVDPGGDLVAWKGEVDAAAPRIVTMGRFDVWHKGLDLAAEMTRELLCRDIEASLHLYGAPVGRFEDHIEELRQNFSDIDMIEHGVVTGTEKFKCLSTHDLYVQFSRFELFGIAMVEALSIGMPVLVSEACDLASCLSSAGGARVLPMDPQAAAEAVAEWLTRPEELRATAARGREWWAERCRADRVERQMTALYRAALAPAPLAIEALALSATGA